MKFMGKKNRFEWSFDFKILDGLKLYKIGV